ncbi:sodium-dependent glucose transporter 1-like [Mizuhopecten yessoensis]|uniref:Sodium-dependent glucose transporter 1 n=1 Tax=Mizuhopecten yessoensis TaxID=6573 RepID=A0A210PW43_MIZYE|nr:sodium-dependent glucose transporter 1-like [Mizuhopecten yessoensis]OWF40708.1 Sodium-dependent glucose transporter 1 [Mizuhopecten yessoensis]
MSNERQTDRCAEHESTPLQNTSGHDSESKHEDEDGESTTSSIHGPPFLVELRSNRSTQCQVVLSTCVAFAFGVLGWSKGQIGPAFLDIMTISGADLETGSAFITAYFVGRVVGSLLCGVLYSKVNTYMLLGIAMTGNSAMFAVIPWCTAYELMIVVHFLHGLAGGLLAVALISIAVSIWGVTARGRAYLNIFYAAFAVSGLFSPIVTSPFLLPAQSYSNINATSWNVSIHTMHSIDVSTTSSINVSNTMTVLQTNVTNFLNPKSNLYKAYSISACVAFLAGIPFIVLFFRPTTSNTNSSKGAEFRFLGSLPVVVKVLQLINVGIFAAVFNAIDFTFSGFLTVFCVQYLQWTKTTGSMLTSVVFGATLTGRILGIFLVHHFNSLTILMFSTIVCSIGFLGLSLSALAYVDAGIWISVCILGIPLGIGWPSILSWSNEHFVPACGKMTAFFMVTAFTGALLSPLLFGYIMEEISPIWFCYLGLGKTLINIVNVVLILIYSRFSRAASLILTTKQSARVT